jgi:hypothetical protein
MYICVSHFTDEFYSNSQNKIHEGHSFCEAKSPRLVKIPPHFMEHEDWLLCLKELATYLNPEPAESSPRLIASTVTIFI